MFFYVKTIKIRWRLGATPPDSFKCFLIITVTKIKRHEKVGTITILCDDPECNKFQKNSKAYVPLNAIGPRLFEDFYII